MTQSTGHINSLPTETLCCIFQHLSPQSETCAPRKKGDRKRDVRIRNILAASQVCRAWRKQALRLEVSWAYIAIPDPSFRFDQEQQQVEWGTALLERSGPKALFVCLELQYAGDEFGSLVERCMARAKHVCIHYSDLCRDPMANVLMQCPAPEMETLSLQCRSNNTTRHIHFEQPAPRELFGGNAPSLMRLIVGPGIPRAISPSIVSELRFYEVLHRASEPTHRHYDLHSQLTLMSAFLEEFINLRKFVIKNDAENLEQFLRKIVVSSSCTIHLVIEHKSLVDQSCCTVRRWMTEQGRVGAPGRLNLEVDKKNGSVALDVEIRRSKDGVAGWWIAIGGLMADEIGKTLFGNYLLLNGRKQSK